MGSIRELQRQIAWVGIPCGSHSSWSVRPRAGRATGRALQDCSEPPFPTARCLHLCAQGLLPGTLEGCSVVLG